MKFFSGCLQFFLFFLSPIFPILLLLFCLLSPFVLSSCCLFPYFCYFFCFSSLSSRSSCFFLGSSCRLCPPFAHLFLLSLVSFFLASLLASAASFFFFYLYSSTIDLLPSHLIGVLPSLSALLLSSLPVFLSDHFLLGVAGLRHLCFRFRCSCPIPGPPPPPFLSLLSSLVPPFPSCCLYLLSPFFPKGL